MKAIDMGIDDSDLKSCPFCGYKANLYYMGSNRWVVRCSNNVCKAEQVVYSSINTAISMWNIRNGK